MAWSMKLESPCFVIAVDGKSGVLYYYTLIQDQTTGLSGSYSSSQVRVWKYRDVFRACRLSKSPTELTLAFH